MNCVKVCISLPDTSLNDTTGNNSSLNKTSEEILNPEVMDNDFDTRSETSEQQQQDVISGGGSDLGKYLGNGIGEQARGVNTGELV